MQNIPVDLRGFKLTVSEAPELKTKQGKDGEPEVVTTKNGEPLYVVALIAKPLERDENGRRGKGVEIKVTLKSDPGEVEEDSRVELVAPVANAYDFTTDEGNRITGMSFKATALKLAA